MFKNDGANPEAMEQGRHSVPESLAANPEIRAESRRRLLTVLSAGEILGLPPVETGPQPQQIQLDEAA